MTEDKISAKVRMGVLRPANEIFEAIVDPKMMSKYFISGSTGRMESGKSLVWTWPDFDGEHEIRVGKIEKDRVISFEWGGSGETCVVVITLEPINENHTIVKVTESDWPADYKGANRCMGQVEGWTHFLCCLKAYLEYNINLRIGGSVQ